MSIGGVEVYWEGWDLSNRAKFALSRFTRPDDVTIRGLFRIKGVGYKTVKEIRKAFSANGWQHLEDEEKRADLAATPDEVNARIEATSTLAVVRNASFEVPSSMTSETLRTRAFAIRVTLTIDSVREGERVTVEWFFRKFGRHVNPVIGTPWLAGAQMFAMPEGGGGDLDNVLKWLSERGYKPVVVEVCCAC